MRTPRQHRDWGSAARAVALSVAVVIASAAAADPPIPAAEEPDRISTGDLAARIRERDQDLRTRIVMLARARASHPQILSAAVGAMLVRQPRHYDCTTVCDYRGPYFEVEPGLQGAQLSLGWGILVGEQGHSDFFVHSVYSGLGIKAALLRTWGGSELEFSDENFYGLEASVSIARANISIGVFRPFSRLPGDDRWLITGGMGWGF